MTLLASHTVRVGIVVERMDSEWVPIELQMFHCRSKDRGDSTHCPLSEWAEEEVQFLSHRKCLPRLLKLKIGEVARYWVHMRMYHYQDYFGEHDSKVKILKCRRIK